MECLAMSDMSSAIKEFLFDLDRTIANAQGLRLSPQVNDIEALEIAIFDLMNARAMLIDALVGNSVAH
jgi:hypothetical protein